MGRRRALAIGEAAEWLSPPSEEGLRIKDSGGEHQAVRGGVVAAVHDDEIVRHAGVVIKGNLRHTVSARATAAPATEKKTPTAAAAAGMAGGVAGPGGSLTWAGSHK